MNDKKVCFAPESYTGPLEYAEQSVAYILDQFLKSRAMSHDENVTGK